MRFPSFPEIVSCITKLNNILMQLSHIPMQIEFRFPQRLFSDLENNSAHPQPTFSTSSTHASLLTETDVFLKVLNLQNYQPQNIQIKTQLNPNQGNTELVLVSLKRWNPLMNQQLNIVINHQQKMGDWGGGNVCIYLTVFSTKMHNRLTRCYQILLGLSHF